MSTNCSSNPHTLHIHTTKPHLNGWAYKDSSAGWTHILHCRIGFNLWVLLGINLEHRAGNSFWTQCSPKTKKLKQKDRATDWAHFLAFRKLTFCLCHHMTPWAPHVVTPKHKAVCSLPGMDPKQNKNDHNQHKYKAFLCSKASSLPPLLYWFFWWISQAVPEGLGHHSW